MAVIDRYLKAALNSRASDLHFSCGEPVRFRIDGDLVALENHPPMDNETLLQMFAEITTEQEQEKLNQSRNLDKSYMAEGIGNFRVNIFWMRRGLAAVLRTIPTKIPTIEDLGLPEVCRKLTEIPKGLVLVTGPTGSGKSTTLAAMLNYINENCPYHILTVEDPVEFVHPSKKCLVNQREIGNSCLSFSDALKYALREDPDVILVGEMRDLETIGLALTAAETGHLVFGTLHTRGAGASVDRIIDSFPANQQAMIRAMLSESLAGVISQALLKKASGSWRVAAYEIMVVNHAISNLIREGKTFQITSIMQTGRGAGMILMEQHVRELLSKGIIAPEEAANFLPELAHAVEKKPAAGAGGPAPTAAAKPAPSAKPTVSGSPAAPAKPTVVAPSTPPTPAVAPAVPAAAMPATKPMAPAKTAPPPPPPMKAAQAAPAKASAFTPTPLKMGEDTGKMMAGKPVPPPAPAKPAARPNIPPAPTNNVKPLDMDDLTATAIAGVKAHEISDEPVDEGGPGDTEDAARMIDLSLPEEASVAELDPDQTGTFEMPRLRSNPGAKPSAPVPPPAPGLKKKVG